MSKSIERQEFTTPATWSTFDVARIKLGAIKYKFANFCTLVFLSENLTIWQESSQYFETVDGKVVANCRVFERVDLFEWFNAEGEAEDIPIKKLS